MTSPPIPALISVVAPAYRCSSCIPELARRIREAILSLPGTDFELIFVNDASPDADWEAILALAAADKRIKGINLSRNFGQHHAITAGVDHCRGDWVVVMDCDLQDRPEELPRLYRKAVAEGWDVVFAQRTSRRDPALKVFLSRGFYRVINALSTIPIDPTTSNFSIASRQVVDCARRLRESSRSYGLSLLWCGFKIGYLPVEHGSRFAGESTYTLKRSLNLAFEAITSQSNKPLRLAINFGFTMSAAAFLYGLYVIIRFLGWGVAVSGWTSLIVSLYFLSGVILAFLGILGLYLGKVFDEVKARPIYLVRQMLNLD